ncbi:MAG: succinate-semialdehyde dehydrogenase/glutarate-semialdehyde dehydrogenase [Bradymonadia bacterium]|jgi:succinate-semialdehyde dehydrogenase/glutarate-semialdehyde dehydrogenase
MIETLNPATGNVLATYAVHTRAEQSARLETAVTAFGKWRDTTMARRAELLGGVASLLVERTEALAQLMTAEMGKPITQARAEVQKCAWVCRHYAEHGAAALASRSVETDASESHVRFDPLGVVLAIMPWNYPLWQVMRFAAPTLMAGNTGLLKHASGTTGCGVALEQLFADAGAPSGVFAHVRASNDDVAAMVADRRLAAVTLTGSVRAGRAVGRLAGENLKPCVLELGGSDPLLVLPGADIGQAVDGAMVGRFLNNGQSCIAAKRFIVVDELHDAFVDLLSARVRAQTVGDPLDERTDIGPMARVELATELEEIRQATRDAGAVAAVKGGQRADAFGDPSAWFEPCLLTGVTPGMRAFDEETFGPLAIVARARDVEHAVELANESEFGLGASVWTEDVSLAEGLLPHIDAGCVSINGAVKSDPRLPFGGVKDSGYGRELSVEGIRSFVNIKSVWIR